MSYKVFRATGIGGMNVFCKADTTNEYGSIAYEQINIIQIRVHLNAAAGADSLVVSQDSAIGTVFDMVYYSEAMNGLTELSKTPTSPLVVSANDDLKLTWANSSGVTWGLEIVYEGA